MSDFNVGQVVVLYETDWEKELYDDPIPKGCSGAFIPYPNTKTEHFIYKIEKIEVKEFCFEDQIDDDGDVIKEKGVNTNVKIMYYLSGRESPIDEFYLNSLSSKENEYRYNKYLKIINNE